MLLNWCPDSQDSFITWETAAATNPAFLSGTYDYIYNLIEDAQLQESMKMATLNHLAKSFITNEVIPALSIYATVNNELPVVFGDATCPAPTNTIGSGDGCPPSDDHMLQDTCCSSSDLNVWCAVQVGSDLSSTVANVDKSKAYVSSLISNLTIQATAMSKETILNLTQVATLGYWFNVVTNIMESGIGNTTCIWKAPTAICVDDPHFDCNGEGFLWCNCNSPYSSCDYSPTSCPTTPTVNFVTFVNAMNVANITKFSNEIIKC